MDSLTGLFNLPMSSDSQTCEAKARGDGPNIRTGEAASLGYASMSIIRVPEAIAVLSEQR